MDQARILGFEATVSGAAGFLVRCTGGGAYPPPSMAIFGRWATLPNFARALEEFFKFTVQQLAAKRLESQRVGCLRKLLLPRLLSGRVEVMEMAIACNGGSNHG